MKTFLQRLMTFCAILSALAGGWAAFEGEILLVGVACCMLIGFVFLEMLFGGQEHVDGFEFPVKRKPF